MTSTPDTGIISVTVLGGLAHLGLRPYVSDHTIRIDTVSSLGLPRQMVDDILGPITQSLQTLPLNLRADSLTVTDSGIAVNLTGGQAALHAAAATC